MVISSRETAYKVRNLRRHPTATLCVFTDNFFGPWIQIDGTAQIVPLPQAMEGLIDYYRRISGEHPDWDDYRTRHGRPAACAHPTDHRQRRPHPRRVAATPRPGNVEAEDGIANATPQIHRRFGKIRAAPGVRKRIQERPPGATPDAAIVP